MANQGVLNQEVDVAIDVSMLADTGGSAPQTSSANCCATRASTPMTVLETADAMRVLEGRRRLHTDTDDE